MPEVYGIVFGMKPTGCKTEECSVFAVDDNDDLKLEGTEGEKFKEFFAQIVEIHNKTTNSILTYHNGFKDQGCQYHGHHWHWVVELRCHPTRDARWGRNCLKLAKDSAGAVFFASQQAKDAYALSRHVRLPPRKVVVERGEMFKYAQTAASTSSTDPEVADPKAKLKRDSKYFQIEFLEKVMNKYHTPDIGALKQHMLKVPDEWNQFRELQSTAAWNQTVQKAQEVFRTQHVHQTFDEIIRNETIKKKYSWNFKALKVMTVYDSKEHMRIWFEHQGFDKEQFMDDLFNVLTKKLPKINTFCLQGEPNSGKSWVLRSLLPWFMYFGEVRQGTGYNFMWQDCLETSLIFVEELMITQEIVEQCKLVFEGAPTSVHVKCKGDQLLQRTPVLITCNHSMWKWVSADADALKARCKLYRTKTAPFLKDVKWSINPLYWVEEYEQYLFRNQPTPATPEQILHVPSPVSERKTPQAPVKLPKKRKYTVNDLYDDDGEPVQTLPENPVIIEAETPKPTPKKVKPSYCKKITFDDVDDVEPTESDVEILDAVEATEAQRKHDSVLLRAMKLITRLRRQKDTVALMTLKECVLIAIEKSFGKDPLAHGGANKMPETPDEALVTDEEL